MGRFKVKKQDTFIDMTPMSDVMVLLLTFFMLTATFVKEEPVKVNAPGSVSEIAVPESNFMTIFVSNDGKVYLTMDGEATQGAMLDNLQTNKSINVTPEQMKKLTQAPTIGVPLASVGTWIDQKNPNDYLLKGKDAGIPCDSVNDELKVWVTAAREANGEDMHIAIKADEGTSYKVISQVMNSLRSIDENRYNLITNLKNEE